jgi:hypothetical protein
MQSSISSPIQNLLTVTLFASVATCLPSSYHPSSSLGEDTHFRTQINVRAPRLARVHEELKREDLTDFTASQKVEQQTSDSATPLVLSERIQKEQALPPKQCEVKSERVWTAPSGAHHLFGEANQSAQTEYKIPMHSTLRAAPAWTSF